LAANGITLFRIGRPFKKTFFRTTFDKLRPRDVSSNTGGTHVILHPLPLSPAILAATPKAVWTLSEFLDHDQLGTLIRKKEIQTSVVAWI
jgi:hypothetical protein